MKKIDYNALRSAIDETIKTDNWRAWWQEGWKAEHSDGSYTVFIGNSSIPYYQYIASNLYNAIVFARLLNLNIEDYVVKRPASYREALLRFWSMVEPDQELIKDSGIRVSKAERGYWIGGTHYSMETVILVSDDLCKMVYYLFRLDLIEDYQLEVQP